MADMAESTRLILPIALYNPNATQNENNSFIGHIDALVHASCSNATPSSLVSWGLNTPEQDWRELNVSRWGAAMGCMDGSLYLFHTEHKFLNERDLVNTHSAEVASIHSDGPRLSRERRPSSLHLPHSSSPSPSSSRTNLGMMSVPKPRAVSGLSKERVEAPKNYVDFEEEEDKLRDMLKDRGGKERSIVDSLNLIPSFEKPFAIERHNRPIFRMTRSANESSYPTREADLPSTPAVNSPPTPVSISPPSSPAPLSTPASHVVPSDYVSPMVLKSFLPTTGRGHPVNALKTLLNGQILATLHGHGLLSLFDTQDGRCIASKSMDIPPSLSHSTIVKQTASSYVLWSWTSLHIFEDEGAVVMLLCACPDPSVAVEPGDAQEYTRICVFEVGDLLVRDLDRVTLIKLGDAIVDGPADSLCFDRDRKGEISIMYLSPAREIIFRPLRILRLSVVDQPPFESNLLAIGALSVPNPFKALSKSDMRLSKSPEASPRLELGEAEKIATLTDVDTASGLHVLKNEMGFMGAVWSSSKVIVFSYEHEKYAQLCTLSVKDLEKVIWWDTSTFTLAFKDHVEVYALQHYHPNETAASEVPEQTHTIIPELVTSTFLRDSDLTCAVSQSQWFSTRSSSKHKRRFELYTLQNPADSTKPKYQRLWSSSCTLRNQDSQPYITSLLPVELSSIVIGYSDGSLRMSGLSELLESKHAEVLLNSEIKNRIHVPILVLYLVNSKNDKIIVGSGDDGSVAFWNLSGLQLRARHILFALPMTHVVQPHHEAVATLRDHIFCISQDGTIGVISPDNLEYLYIIPGSPAPLYRIRIEGDNLLLMYTDDRARLWDMKTRIFLRSMEKEKAEGLLDEGNCFDARIGSTLHSGFSQPGHSALTVSTSITPVPAINIDIASIVTSAATTSRGTNEKISLRKARLLEQVMPLLRVSLPLGLDENIDSVVREHLKYSSTDAAAGIYGNVSGSQHWIFTSAKEFWQTSGYVTASRLLIIVTLLRLLFTIDGYQSSSSTILSFYATALADVVGHRYAAPDLAYLAYHWSDSPFSEVRQAARTLFESEVIRLSDKEIISIMEKWQHRLPCVLPDADKQSPAAGLALHLAGNVAVERFNLLSSNVLTDIAKSITIYLFDEGSPHRALAIDLCSRGFQTWQQYFDAVAVLRMLFSLATDSKKENISMRNMGSLARSAVLQIASGNAPLFMTTLSLDILHPHSVEYSKSIMQLIAYLIGKRPQALYPNVPRLIEAVVKSLDPNSSSNREAVLDSATEILGQIVRTYPTVDFHMGTQRLAVGTNEGAIIMYDLKTATRLYVLEGHRKKLAAISYSPDGRRLVTVSLEEGIVFVWKVGSSFTSLFKPGAPPRQGQSGSQPYKSLNFNVGEQANMSTAAIFESLSFEWPSSRSVKIKIRDSILTFST